MLVLCSDGSDSDVMVVMVVKEIVLVISSNLFCFIGNEYYRVIVRFRK